MKDAAHLLARLVEREGSLTAAIAAMGSDKTLAYWSKFRKGMTPISHDEYKLLRAAVPGGRKRRKNISVHPETWAALENQKPGLQTWDEWLLNMLALWNMVGRGGR